MNIVFPDGGGIAGFVYWLIKGIMSWGWVSYGFAIVFFTLFLKLMLSPLDFGNKYLNRKNQIKRQALASEEADLNKIYANDPLALARARQELYRKNGVGGFGSTLFTLATLIITMVVFFQVMGALNEISRVNIYHQYEELSAVYEQYKDGDAETLKTELNKTYNDTKMSFFWIKNIWQADTPWTKPIMTFEEFNKSQPKDRQLAAAQKDTYNAIFDNIDAKHNTANGWLLLAVLAGVTSFVSAKLANVAAARNAPKKEAKAAPEQIITYSLRDAKAQGNAPAPTVDPAQVNKIMQFIMPVIFMIFALSQTSAFAIYMIASSLISTFLTIGFSLLIDLIIKKQKPTPGATKEFDASIINPHAKYFKGGKK